MSKNSTDIPFEEALERLEALIESMESGDTPLAELVAKFEEGSKLLQNCQSKLKDAELKIEKLNLENGETEAFEGTKDDA